MPIYLGSTAVDDLYLGDVVYGEPNVVRVYLGTDQVWPNEYAVTFSTDFDGVCTSNPSLIGVSYGSPAYFILSLTFTTTGPASVTWQGSSDNGQTWHAISGFGGYHSTNASGELLYMSSYSGPSYYIRAVVDGVATTSVSAVGNYIDFPPCEP